MSNVWAFFHSSTLIEASANSKRLGSGKPLEGIRYANLCHPLPHRPNKEGQFEEYSRNWRQAIPRRGADLIGYYALYEGSSTLAYGIYNVASLADYEAYRSRLAADPLGRENYEFAQKEKFLLREDRTWLTLASAPHGEST